MPIDRIRKIDTSVKVASIEKEIKTDHIEAIQDEGSINNHKSIYKEGEPIECNQHNKGKELIIYKN